MSDVANLDTMVTVVDSINFLKDYDEAKYLQDTGESLGEEDERSVADLLVDQGDADSFLDNGLRPWLLETACQNANINLTLRMQAGYDHSYFFISTFMDDHLRWHAERL